MGRYLEPGHVYTDGQTISGASLTEHVSDALLKVTSISEQLAKDPAESTDEILINDSGNFKKITLQVLKTLIAQTLTLDDFTDTVRGQLIIPVGMIADFAGTTEPDGWLFCYGQSISRTTYDLLFEAIGTTYGIGDGVNTFTLPDCRGRVAAGKDNMGGTSANRLVTYLNGDTLAGTGGTETHTLGISEIPSHTHPFSYNYPLGVVVNGLAGGPNFNYTPQAQSSTTSATGGGAAHTNLQPTIIFNKIIRAL